MTKKTKDRIILCVNLLLIIALTFSIFTIVQKSNDLSAAKSEIKHKQSTIEKQTESNAELESKLEKSEKENSEIQSELDSVKKEKKKLESENSSLKKQIKELKAKKQGAATTTVKKTANKTTKKTAVAQNPKPTGKVCYLTFDDGPTANTLKILKILDEYDVKATFFVIDTAQTKIQYVKQIYAAGHTVGLHSNSHNYANIYKSTDAYFADLTKISNTVKKYTGVESKVIRFPGGGSNTISRNYKKGIMTTLTSEVTKKGYTYFDWNVDSCDASATTVSATKITNNVLNGAKNKSSICVLMHDAKAKTTTVDALPKIIEGLKKQGYTFKPLTKDCYGYHHSVNN